LNEVVFVGGCATGLLIDDPGAAVVRKTFDVDVIAEIASYAEYGVFSERLRHLKFTEDTTEGAPLCRWKYLDLTLDVMPLDPRILGFSNRWYEGSLRASQPLVLQNGSQFVQSQHRISWEQRLRPFVDVEKMTILRAMTSKILSRSSMDVAISKKN
jgi:hypothetical protein